MKKQELDPKREEALRRYRIIAPLVEEDLAESERRNIRWLIREQEGMSSRTLRRYVAAFKKGGFDALLPRERKDKEVCKTTVTSLRYAQKPKLFVKIGVAQKIFSQK